MVWRPAVSGHARTPIERRGKGITARTQAGSHRLTLFTIKTGERITYNDLVSLVQEVAKEAGVPRPGPHDFRRAFALNMLRNGCDLISLAR